jgi:hypothetical protein
MVQKGGQTIAPDTGFLGGILKAATKIFSSTEPTTTLGTATRPQALATPLQNSLNSGSSMNTSPSGSSTNASPAGLSLRPSMQGGKRKRTRKNKRSLRKKRTFRR